MTDRDDPGSHADPEDADRSEFSGDRLSRLTAPPELDSDANRKRWGLGDTKEDRGPYMVELNVQFVDGLAGAGSAFRELFQQVVVDPAESELKQRDPWRLAKVSKAYFRADMNVPEWTRLIAADERRAAERAGEDTEAATAERDPDEFRYRVVYKLWPDFPVRSQISRSVATIKGDAALRSFEATGEGVTWAVIDSGVDASHPHFGPPDDHALNDPSVRSLHRCFVSVPGVQLEDPDEELTEGPVLSKEERRVRQERHREHALVDPLGHGTHVAGIIAGRVPRGVPAVVLEQEERIIDDERESLPKRRKTTKERVVRSDREKERFHGVAPGSRLVSLRVLDEQGGGRSSNIVRALEYVREKLNDNPKLLRVHGVNLSVGYEFDAEMFACGQSPLCTEVNRLVQSGVVVVTAAGNTGYSTLTANGRVTKVGLSNTINDPGNAQHAITVGSTHRESPHMFGISYFSSKGPTGDGRLKPDLVAPGERILSCAAGKKKDDALERVERRPNGNGPAAGTEDGQAVGAPATADGAGTDASPRAGCPSEGTAYYVEDSGTSMAAPHVSGAIAAFLSIRREFIGRPLEVKQIFLESATPLGRERYFEGHGLLDLMRAIQSI
jgi:subtilisin family serine protease